MSKKEVSKKKKCTKCEKDRFISRDFYMSNSDKHRDGLITVCKQCFNKDLEVRDDSEFMSEVYVNKVKDTLLEMNRPYIHSVWIDSVEEVKKRGWKRVFGMYLKNLQLNHKDKNWRDSEFPNSNANNNSEKTTKKESRQDVVKKKHNIELDTQNEKDVLRLLGYDPFQHESDEDRSMLYNRLVDYLSEDVLEDGLRLSSAISIVRTFNQIDKLDASMAAANPSDVGALVTAKQKLHNIINSIAKENGFSVGASNKQSAGSGTLTGIMKQLQEYDFHEATVNLFDIETAMGIEQVANLSNKNIMEQLKFDENDYSEMMRDQRLLIDDFEKRAKKAEEENRSLRVELDKRNKNESSYKERIEELENKLKNYLEEG